MARNTSTLDAHRGGRRSDALLGNELFRTSLDPAQEIFFFRRGHGGGEFFLLSELRKGRQDRQLIEVRANITARVFPAAPPGGRGGHEQLLVQKATAQSRQEVHLSRRLDHAAAQRIVENHRTGARRLQQSRNAQKRVAPQLQRIAKAIVQTADQQIHRLQSGQRLDVDAAVAHREVRAFHQREAPVAGKKRVFKVVLVVWPRGQHDDPRLAPLIGGYPQQSVALGVEKSSPAGAPDAG